MAQPNILAYTAQVLLPSGQLYTFSGSQPVTALTAAGFTAAATAMGADIANQLNNGVANDPSFLVQQTTAQISD